MSELKTNKISPATGTTTTLGDASDVFQLPASAEIDIASGATLDVNGTIDVTGATVTGLSAGKVLQVLMMETTSSTTFASTTYADSNLTLNITPASSSSQILIQWTVQVQIANGGQLRGLGFKLLRDSTAVYTSGSLLDIGFKPTTDNPYLKGSWYAIDSPATTSQITYKVQAASYSGYSVGFPSSSNGAQLLLWEIGA